jgi:hypothetical protein
MAPIPAATIGQMETAAQASRFLARYAMELQSARDSIVRSREAFSAQPKGLYANGSLAENQQSLFDATERARRSLDTERDAICLASRAIRERLASANPSRKPWVDRVDFPLGGLTILAYFVSARRLDAVEWMLWAGAAPEAQNADGSTALDVATRKARAYAGAGSAMAAMESSSILSSIEAASLGALAAKGDPMASHRL